jgi:putative endonuclease
MTTTTEIGRRAEAAARAYLEMRGFKIIEQNYRRPSCEVDIIASKDGVVHFVEVKYRSDDEQGGGLEAITPAKLKRMRRAAWTWVDEYKWRGEYILSAMEMSGPRFTVLSFIENVF